MPSKTVKQIAFGLLSSLASFEAWRLLHSISAGGYAHVMPWIYFAIAFGIAEGFLLLASLARKPLWPLLFSVISSGLFLLVFGLAQNWLAASGVFLLGNLSLIFFPWILRSRMNMDYFGSAYKVSWVAGLALLAFIAYMLSGIASASAIAQKTTGYVWPYVQANLYPFNSEQTIDSFLISQLKQSGISRPSQSMVEQALQQLDNQTGQKFSGSQTMSSAGRQIVSGKIEQVIQSTSVGSNMGYLIFLILLVLLPVVRFVIALFSYALFEIAYGLKLIKAEESQVTVKTIDL